MNILLINHYAGHPGLGMEFRPFYLAREWVKLGHVVTILSADYSHLRYAQPAGNGVRVEVIEGIRYVWLPTRKYNGNGLGRLINIVQFLATGLKYLKNENAIYDHIIASSTYPLDVLLAKYISKDTPITFELHDIWPMTLYTVGDLPKLHPFVLLMSLGEKLSYKLCDKVVSILSNAYAHVSLFGIRPENYCYIPNGVPGVSEPFGFELSREGSTAIKTIESLKNDFKLVAGYVGGHAISNNLDVLISAAEITPEVAFVFIGSGSEKERLKRKAYTSKNIVFLEPVKKNEVATILGEMDILMISWADEELYKYGTGANKVFDYLISGKPIIQAINSPNNPVQLAGAGLTVPPGDFRAFANAIEKLSDKELRATLGENGVRYVGLKHQYSNLAKEYIEFITA